MSSSASTIAAGATSGYHVLKIKGYSFIKSAFPNGKYIESRTFRVAGHTWAINYYPNGITSVAADYVPFYLRLCHPGAAADVRVKMVFTFIDEVEMQAPSYVRARTPRRFVANNTSWGYEKFIKRENLERSERFKGDCFTVRCDIIVAPARSTRRRTTPQPFVVPPPPRCLRRPTGRSTSAPSSRAGRAPTCGSASGAGRSPRTGASSRRGRWCSARSSTAG
ncbi:hypothetical protein SEVIR_9G250355v4 [Setaria viridis]